jgi:SAM-dependent methyltransferase
MTNAFDWQGSVGRNWAAEWQRTDTSFSALTPQLLAAIGREPGEVIVDIGCGAGELAIAVAGQRPQARVIGCDISGDLISAASERGGGLSNLSFILADAAVWQPETVPDLYVSRHGVMFFADPPAAFAHLAAVAAPGARIVFSCFRAPVHNDWATAIAQLLPPPEPVAAPEFAQGPFAFADPTHVRRCMTGWRDVEFVPVDFDYVAGAGRDPVREAMALFGRIGPSAFAMRTLPEAERAAFEKRLRELVEAHSDGTHVTFKAAAWLITATSDHHHG